MQLALWTAGIFVSVVLFVLNQYMTKRRARKALTWKVVTNQALVTRANKATGVIEMLYNGKVVKNVRLVQVQVKNIGGVPIQKSDFERPVTIEITDGGVLEAEIAESLPEGFNPELEVVGSSVTLLPTLMNQGDMLTIKIWASMASAKELTVTGRIIGVPEVPTVYDDRGYDLSLIMFQALILPFSGLLAACTGVAWLANYLGKPIPIHPVLSAGLSMSMLVIGVIILVTVIMNICEITLAKIRS